MIRILVAAGLAALTVPLALPRREAASVPAPSEIVSLPDTSRSRVKLSDLDVKTAWNACVGLELLGVPAPLEARERFVASFFDGRLPAAAGFVRDHLAGLDDAGAARLADRARSFDRALVLMRPAPAALLRLLVERADEPDAHVDAVRANEAGVARLVGDPALGARAYGLLRAAGLAPAAAISALRDRAASDAWAREALQVLGNRAIPALLDGLEAPDARRRSASACVLAAVAGPAYADRILQAALPELGRDGVPGNAVLAVRALSALGGRARPAVRGLLKSGDDQAVAAALQVLMRTGGATAEELDAARSRVERLAARAGEAGDEASIGVEVRASLGVATGALRVPDPPAPLNPSQTGTAARDW